MSFSLSKFLSDPKALEGVVTAAFGVFDKNHSGFIEVNEMEAVAVKVCHLVGMKEPPVSTIHSIFTKAAGADGKVSKEEFSGLVQALFKHLGHGKPAAAAPAAH